MLIQLDQFLERSAIVITNAQHQTDVRIAEGQLRAGLAGRTHDSPQEN
jgi:hypothetical protein